MDSTEPPYSRPDLRKSKRRFLTSSRRLVTTPRPLLSFPFPDGTATTCSKPPATCPGSKDGRLRGRESLLPRARPSLRPLTPSFHPQDPLTSPLGCPCRMSTKLEVLEQYLLAESRLVSLSQVC